MTLGPKQDWFTVKDQIPDIEIPDTFQNFFFVRFSNVRHVVLAIQKSNFPLA
jgi:hypothetical protein